MSEELRRGIPKPIVTGRVQYTKEEEEQHKKDFERVLKHFGVLEPDENLDDLQNK